MAVIERLESQLRVDGLAQEDSEFTLTDGQKEAVEAISRWYRKRHDFCFKRHFVLAGAAGTGKSSLIRYIIANLGLLPSEVLCSAYTGKAALNMKRKGSEAHTLHSAMYDGRRTPEGELVFTRKNFIPYSLVIVDEASMISERMFGDIMSFGKPVLFVGDHCQLPPIEGSFNIMETPDHVLTEIMRQAAMSPVIRASQLAMTGKEIPFCSFEGFRKCRMDDLTEEDIMNAGQIVVGTNRMRRAINSLCREIRGLKGSPPRDGERMIVLQNNRRFNVYNGQLLFLNGDPFLDSNGVWNGDFFDEVEMESVLQMVGRDPMEMRFLLQTPPMNPNGEVVYMDYGYAISCHKAQGSGWDDVMVFDEVFGRDEDTRRRWLYTAITRAKKRLTIVK